MDFNKIRSTMSKQPRQTSVTEPRQSSTTHANTQGSEWWRMSQSEKEALMKAIQEHCTKGVSTHGHIRTFNGSDFMMSTDIRTGKGVGIAMFPKQQLPSLAEAVREELSRHGTSQKYVATLFRITKEACISQLQGLHERSLKNFLAKQTLWEVIGDVGSLPDVSSDVESVTSLSRLQKDVMKTKKVIKICREQEEYLARTYLLEAELWAMVGSIESNDMVLRECIEFKQKPGGNEVYFKSADREVDLDLRAFMADSGVLLHKADDELNAA